MTPTMTATTKLTTNLKSLMTAVKNFLASIAAIGNDDYEMYVLEKELKPAYRQHNPYSGVFSA